MTPPERDAAPAVPGADVNTNPNRTPKATAHEEPTLPFGPSARHRDPWTSWAASRDPEGYRITITDQVVVLIARAGTHGCTVFELVAKRGGDRGSIARRCTDAHRAGWIRASGTRKSPYTGRPSTVWAATSSGLEHAAAALARLAEQGQARDAS